MSLSYVLSSSYLGRPLSVLCRSEKKKEVVTSVGITEDDFFRLSLGLRVYLFTKSIKSNSVLSHIFSSKPRFFDSDFQSSIKRNFN